MDFLNGVNDFINNIVWGVPMIVLILGTGVYLTFRLGFVQVTKIREIFKNTVRKVFSNTRGKGLISSGEAALLSLGEIVGSGNIAGVATAIAAGGPGALFWMWVAAFFGMAIKFAEITLGVVYRKVSTANGGNIKGGPMYYLKDGLHSKFLAVFYAAMAVLSYIVIVAMIDTNTIVNAVTAKFSISPVIIALIIMLIIGIIIFGGVKRLGNFSKWFVPFMGVLYVVCGLVVIGFNYSLVGDAFITIFRAAFTPQAAFGGFAGASISQIIRYGLARGIYSNEAGLGTAAIAHATAKTDSPIKQAMWGPVEVFFDTIVVNTITGLIVVIAGVWGSGIDGAELVMNSFDVALPGGAGSIIIMITSIMFSFTCLTSASYVCEECCEFLFGEKSKYFVRIFWLIFIFVGAISSLEFVWNLADTVNGLMLIPNLIGIIFLSGKVINMKKEYFKSKKGA